MSASPYRLDAAGSPEESLVLEFCRHRDRWQHRWLLDRKGQLTVWMISVEGDDAQVWPPSPPLQELDRLTVPAGPAIFGVGRGGLAHWSVSFLQDRQPIANSPASSARNRIADPISDSAPPAAGESILAEWACCWKPRLATQQTNQPTFQSTYRLADGVIGQPTAANRVELGLNDARLIIEVLETPPHRSHICLEGNLLVIAAILSAEPAPKAPNVRWNFRVSSRGRQSDC